ncbi:MAG: ATP-binding protein [Ilumatobacteraceae bacterium]
MAERLPSAPGRFLRRLTAAFVLVAAVSAGLVAVVTFVLVREYRWRNFRTATTEETRFALALTPGDLNESTFERFRTLYEMRSDAHIVVVQGAEAWQSSADIGPDDIPAGLSVLSDEPVVIDADVGGRPMTVAGADGGGGASYYLFFDLDELQEGLAELWRAAALSWIATTVVAGAIGRVVARRTLRPVAAVATAAEAIAEGDLTTRLPYGATDEFGTLARSFNHMADEVTDLVGRLADAAARERRFTADVAHELRTPLTGMMASSALLREQLDDLPPELRRPATILVNDVERLGTLVLELLELSRLEAASDEPHVAELDVRAAIDAVVAGAASRRMADIAVDVEPGLVAVADPVGFRRIVANLLDNAIVHGGGTAHVTATDHGRSVAIDIADDGPGITDGELDRVFDRFHKSDHSRASGGSGLGLAIAREYARSQAGTLTVRNEPGRGARFTLDLPTPPRGNGGSGVTEP